MDFSCCNINLTWGLYIFTLDQYTTCITDVFCPFAGQKPVRTDNRRYVRAWTAFVRGEAFPNSTDGPWCHQVQPPDYGLLLAHSSASQAWSDSDGQPDLWVGNVGLGVDGAAKKAESDVLLIVAEIHLIGQKKQWRVLVPSFFWTITQHLFYRIK